MLNYIYYAVAVIVLVAAGVLAIALLRKRAHRGMKDMTFADPADDFVPADDAGPAPAAGPAAADAVPPADAQQGVEQLLAEWRAEHERATAAGDTARPPASVALDVGPAGPAVAATAYVAVPPEAPIPPAAPAPVTAPAPAETPAPTPAPSAAALLADPLGVVILDMAEGKGKLSGQELKRLEVFRPDRIQMATETVQLPLRLERDDEVLMRFAQIRLYAATLDLRSKWASQIVAGGDNGLPDVPFSARDFKLKIARDIMALPAGDRAEVIGFLLGGLLNTTGAGPRLKQAIIDTLEHLRSAALVNVLLDCLDDPDPIIQDYALAAADRLLDGA